MKKLHLALFASVATGPLLAQETRDLDAHVHGVSTLELAIEDGAVEMTLLSPGMDIVGFEYEATTDADKDAVDAAIRVLQTPENIVSLPDAAGCRLTEVLAIVESGDHDHDEGDMHAHDKHDEGEAHDEHDEHAHEEASGHSAFRATYNFACANPEELTSIDFPFFAQFENAQEIEAVYVTETGAGSAEIGRNAATLTLE